MQGSKYICLFNASANNKSYVPLISTAQGGETAGSIAYTGFSNKSAYFGGETAGSVARSTSCSSSSGGCASFTAIA